MKLAKTPKEAEELLKRREENKPEDRAEQFAEKVAWFETIYKLIPVYLRYENGEPVFPTKDEQNRFNKIVAKDSAMFSLLSGKYSELMTMIADRQQEIKNSSTPDSEAGNSSKE